MYISSAPYDMYSFAENGSFDIDYDIPPKNIDPIRTAKQTIHRHNEFVLKRKDSEGNILMPTCIINFGETPSELQIQASKFYGLPILKIKANNYVNMQRQKINNSYRDLLSMEYKEGSVIDFLYSLTAYVYGFSWKNRNFPYEDSFLSLDKIPELIKELLTKFQGNQEYNAIKEIELFINDTPSNRNYTVRTEMRETLNSRITEIYNEQNQFEELIEKSKKG